MRKLLSLFLFYSWGNWGTKKLTCPRTELHSADRIQTEAVWLQSQTAFLTLPLSGPLARAGHAEHPARGMVSSMLSKQKPQRLASAALRQEESRLFTIMAITHSIPVFTWSLMAWKPQVGWSMRCCQTLALLVPKDLSDGRENEANAVHLVSISGRCSGFLLLTMQVSLLPLCLCLLFSVAVGLVFACHVSQ